jgi:hypothetical protein
LANDYDRIATELDRRPDLACGPAPSATPSTPSSWLCGNDS